jgi:hypothetical protein
MEIHGKSVIFQSFSRKTVENLQTGYELVKTLFSAALFIYNYMKKQDQ